MSKPEQVARPETMAERVKGGRERRKKTAAVRQTVAGAKKQLGVVKPAESRLYAAVTVVESFLAKIYNNPPFQRDSNLWAGCGGSVGEDERQYVESCMATNDVPGTFYLPL